MELLERVEEENESFTRAVGRFANERYFQEFIIFVASPSYFDGLTTVSKGYRQYLGLWLSMEGKWDSALLLPAHEKFVHAYNQFKGDISTSRQRLKELRNAIR
jgi:hypothetical protein